MNTIIRSSDVMRYPTAGDYYEENGSLVIEVYNQENEDKTFLVALHELVEQYLTKKRGITNEQIDEFDLGYENNRSEDDDTSEPGDHPDCPYRKEHRFAMIIEQMMAHEIGVDWQDHDKNIKVYEPVS
jgi:hypothetical protein